jgi:molecular chaperone HscB
MRFDVDDKEIERAWLLRSSKVHPDRFVKKTDRERRFAVEHTAALNDAKRAIKDPFDRATWLVRHAGIDAAALDQRLLVLLMEARERAEESESDKRAIVDDSAARFHALAASLAPLLSALDATPALQKAARALAEMKTLARLVADLGGPTLIATLDGR